VSLHMLFIASASCYFNILFSNYFQGYSRTRELKSQDLLEHLPALQQLLYRLIGCKVVLSYVLKQQLG
jgi:hypothetical protein